MSQAGSPDLANLSRLLGWALHKGDYNEFLKIYDHVIPDYLSSSELEQIKEQARVVALKLEHSSCHDVTSEGESLNPVENRNEFPCTIMASPMSESQQWSVDDVDEHHRHDDDVIDYCPLTRSSPKPLSPKLRTNQDYDESVTPDSSSAESESPRVATVGQQWDEEHPVETSSHSGQSQDEEQPASWSRSSVKPASRSGNGELRTPTLSSVISGRNLKPKAIDVDQSVELPLYKRAPIESRSSGVASTSVRCSSASTTDVGRAKGEQNSFYRLPSDTSSGRVSVSTPFLEMSSHSREPVCDENGNPVESSRGAAQYYPAAKSNHETFGSSILHRMAERDRDEQPGRRPDKDSARLLERIKKRRTTKSKDNKGILAQEIPGHRGDRARPVEELLSYINGTKQPVEAALVPNGDSKLEKKVKRAGEKGKKSGHEAVSGKVCESKPVGKLSSSSKHTSVPDGEVVEDNKTAVNASHGTATCNSWAYPIDEERPYNTSDVASYNAVTFADIGSNDVNVSSSVTTIETLSVDLVAQVPTSNQEDLVVSSVQKEPPSATPAPIHFEAWDMSGQSDHLPDVVQSSESFLTVIKKKKSKDIMNPARCASVGTHRQSVAGYPQAGHRHHGAPMEHLSRAAASFKDTPLEFHDVKGCHDLLALPKDATEVLSANGFRDAVVDFPPMRPQDRRDECVGGTAAAAGVDIHATLYAGVADDSSHKRTWAKVASKPANPGPVDRVHHEPDRELQHKRHLRDVGLSDGQLCVAAGPPAVCPPLCVESAGAQSVCCKPDNELKPEQPRLPAVSMPITSMTVLPMADVVFGYSPDVLCDNPVPTKVSAATAGSCYVSDRPLRGVEFCGSMMYVSPAPFTISFGCGDILDDESEPLDEGLQFGDLQQQNVCCSVAVDSVRLAGAQNGDVPPAHDILATSPMVEGRIGATQTYAVSDYEQLSHARAIQFLTKEYAAVLELHHKSPNRVVMYTDSEDGICTPHT